MTGIHGGERVPKDDIRIEANGCIDELNSVIGVVRTMIPERDPRQKMLFLIQRELMSVMSHVATPSSLRADNPNALSEELTGKCEMWMDEMMSGLRDNGYFILPGGTQVSAYMQWARTIARRAERRLWTLNRKDPVPESILVFMNRLSDFFFVMARREMQDSDLPEEKWREFSYKRKSEKENR